MSHPELHFRPGRRALLSLYLLTAGGAFGAAEWRPVDPAALASRTPAVEKGADAEALFWDVRVHDEFDGGELHSVLNHYIRIKIYTDRGKETQGKVDVLSIGRTRISGIAGRTIKPDGSIVELDRNTIFDRVLAQAEGIKVRAKSFAMPAVEAGCIIEYRWQEVRADQLANYVRLQFQRDIPVQRVTYHVKPLTVGQVTVGMNSVRFQMPAVNWVKEPGGFSSATLENVPPFRREPDMPPDDQVRSWMLVYYTMREPNAEKYWLEFGKDRYRLYKGLMKVDNEIRAAAAKASEGGKTDEEKLRRLFDYCRTEVKNKSARGSGLTAENLAALKANRTPADTLRQRYGSSREIDLLFGALATAAGFDVRYALVADRTDAPFKPSFSDVYFLRNHLIAVRVGDKWRFFDPSSTHLPFGMLDWQQEGATAFIPDPKEPVFVRTPLAAPGKSVIRRKGTFQLDAAGTLEGDVSIEYTGHRAQARRQSLAGESEEQQRAALDNSVKARIRTAVLGDVKIENATDADKPFIERYHVRIPGFAQRTGKRLLVPVAFFQFNVGARYPNSERAHPLFYRYPWAEQDNLTIRLPDGFEMENPEAPQPVRFNPVGEYRVQLAVTKDKRTLVYGRILIFGNDGQMVYEPVSFPSLKKIFDAIHGQDQHMVGLKIAEARR